MMDLNVVISGRYDRDSATRSSALDHLDEILGIKVAETECAHLLSKSTNVGICEGSRKVYLDI